MALSRTSVSTKCGEVILKNALWSKMDAINISGWNYTYDFSYIIRKGGGKEGGKLSESKEMEGNKEAN